MDNHRVTLSDVNALILVVSPEGHCVTMRGRPAPHCERMHFFLSQVEISELKNSRENLKDSNLMGYFFLISGLIQKEFAVILKETVFQLSIETFHNYGILELEEGLV